MATTKHKPVPPPPPESASDAVKAAYYEKHDVLDLLDAGYLEEVGVFEGDECLTDLKPERGRVAIPIDAQVARRLRRVARRAGCTPSELATRCLAESLHVKADG